MKLGSLCVLVVTVAVAVSSSGNSEITTMSYWPIVQ